MRNGCAALGEPSAAARCYLRALRRRVPALAHAEHVAGRIVLSASDPATLGVAKRFADRYGLSYYDGSCTVCTYVDPSVTELTLLCGLARDPAVDRIVLLAEDLHLMLRPVAERVRVEVMHASVALRQHLLHLGLEDDGRGRDDLVIATRKLPLLLIGALQPVPDIVLTAMVHEKPHLVLVHASVDLLQGVGR